MKRYIKLSDSCHATIDEELGRYTDKLQAAKAYDEAAIKYFGEFARLNSEA